jgi:hypothetical protein
MSDDKRVLTPAELAAITERRVTHYDLAAQSFWAGPTTTTCRRTSRLCWTASTGRRRSRSWTSAAGRARSVDLFSASGIGRSAWTDRRASSRWRARSAVARSCSRTSCASICPPRASTPPSPTPHCSTSRGRSCRACCANCTRRLSRAGCSSAPTRAATTRKDGRAAIATACTMTSRPGKASWKRPASTSSYTTLAPGIAARTTTLARLGLAPPGLTTRGG